MTNTHARWVLPAGVKEFLPEQARHIEELRRKVLQVFEQWGYEPVIPPLMEYLDSLLIADDDTLDIQTFKLTDQMSGRQLGVRADMTPQVARMDAHSLSGRKNDSQINRLCYVDTVLRARPDNVGGSRTQMQFGAEVYGSDAPACDISVVNLMLETLKSLGFESLCLDLGHVGIPTALIREAGLDETQEKMLLGLLQRRSQHEMEQQLSQWSTPTRTSEMLLQLVDLNGDCEQVAKRARECFKGAPKEVIKSLDALDELSELIKQRSDATLHYDLADPHGFHYQTGIVYAVYKSGLGRELARGGRYDDFGKVFGRARPSTGFSGDLLFLSEMLKAPSSRPGIFAPQSDDAAMWSAISQLREQGERVVEQLGEGDTAQASGCDRVLSLVDGQWTVQKAP